jgi:hypothetical protein
MVKWKKKDGMSESLNTHTSVHLKGRNHLGDQRTKEGGGINPLDTALNPTCHLLALLGAQHFLHVSRIRVKISAKEIGF